MKVPNRDGSSLANKEWAHLCTFFFISLISNGLINTWKMDQTPWTQVTVMSYGELGSCGE